MAQLRDTDPMRISAAPSIPKSASLVAGWLRARAGLVVSLGAFLFVVAVGISDGGYFPTAWAWCVLASAWIAGVALIVRARVVLGRLELALLAALLGLIVWTALSVLWSSDVEQSVLEVQRGLVYLVGVLAAVLVVRRETVGYLLGGVLAGVVAVSARALASRLFPGAGPDAQVLDIGRLAEGISYFNALGLFAVMGALLALGFAVHGRQLFARAAAAAALPILLTTAYFTFSRGAALALAVGLVAALVLDTRRLRFITIGVLVAAPAGVAVWLSSQESGLTSTSAARAVIADEGRDVASVLIATIAASAVIAVLCGLMSRRIQVPRAARLAYGAVLACAALTLLTVGLASQGGPVQLVRDAYHNVDQNRVDTGGDRNDLNGRLGSISSMGRVQQYEVAWRQYKERPLLGTGAGTFEQYWLRYRPIGVQVRDAHNLYLETLAQLGLPGLAILLALLAVPVAGAWRARRHPLAAAVFGAYVAYLVHTGIDWDWEIPAVTLPALVCGVALIAARPDGSGRRWELSSRSRVLGVGVVLALAAFSMIGLAGNRALDHAAGDVSFGDFRAAAEDAETAMRWAPWSAEAHQLLGRARSGLGEDDLARASLLQATRMSPDDWQSWYDLGLASKGREQRRAFVRAATLNPREADIERLRQQGFRLPPAGGEG